MWERENNLHQWLLPVSSDPKIWRRAAWSPRPIPPGTRLSTTQTPLDWSSLWFRKSNNTAQYRRPSTTDHQSEGSEQLKILHLYLCKWNNYSTCKKPAAPGLLVSMCPNTLARSQKRELKLEHNKYCVRACVCDHTCVCAYMRVCLRIRGKKRAGARGRPPLTYVQKWADLSPWYVVIIDPDYLHEIATTAKTLAVQYLLPIFGSKAANWIGRVIAVFAGDNACYDNAFLRSVIEILLVDQGVDRQNARFSHFHLDCGFQECIRRVVSHWLDRSSNAFGFYLLQFFFQAENGEDRVELCENCK